MVQLLQLNITAVLCERQRGRGSAMRLRTGICASSQKTETWGNVTPIQVLDLGQTPSQSKNGDT